MRLMLLALIMMLSLAACAETGDDGAVQAVEDYLQAKIEGDRDTLSRLLCSEMESSLDREALSFSTVTGAEIIGMSCEKDGDIVTCEGEIIATYGTNDQNFPLRSYRVVEEDGEWKWCGEAG